MDGAGGTDGFELGIARVSWWSHLSEPVVHEPGPRLIEIRAGGHAGLSAEGFLHFLRTVGERFSGERGQQC